MLTEKNGMKKALVVDTSVFLTYAAYDKIYRLVDAIQKYSLLVYVNDNLLNEIERNLYNSVRVENANPILIFEAIKENTKLVSITSSFTQSPDPKDNFLFDLAIQTNSEILVTQEKALLAFKESPVIIHDLKWFKETYPVPL